MDIQDLEFVSRSQTPAQMAEAMEAMGLEATISASTDQPEPVPAQEPTVETTEATPEPAIEEPPAPVATPAKKPNSSKERKIAKLSSQLDTVGSELAREKSERERLERELSEARRQPVATPAPVPTPAPAAPVVTPTALRAKPTRAEFFDKEDPDEAYQEALTDWKLDSREHAKQTADAQVAADKAAKDRADQESLIVQRKQESAEFYATRIAQTKVKYPDFDTVLAAAKTPEPFSHALLGAMEEFGPEMLYAMAKDQVLLDKIVAATRMPEKPTVADYIKAKKAAVREFTKIEEQLAAAVEAVAAPDETEDDAEDDDADEAEVTPEVAPIPPPAPPVPTSTPARTPKPKPVVPVGGRGGSPVKAIKQMTDEEIRNMPMDEYRKKVYGHG